MQARLAAKRFDVLTAASGLQALDLCGRERVDLVLLDVMMPGMDGLEVCRVLKSQAATRHIPVVLVTALDRMSEKLRGIEAGADDVLTKPVEDLELMTRVRTLVELKMLDDELKRRIAAGAQLSSDRCTDGGQILLVEEHARSASRMAGLLSPHYDVHVMTDALAVLGRVARGDVDLAAISLRLPLNEGLRLCQEVRASPAAAGLSVIAIVDPDDTARLQQSLDAGVDDYLVRPLERQPTLARIGIQMKRKRYIDLGLEFACNLSTTGHLV